MKKTTPKKRRLKTFSVTTKTDCGTFVFMTKARDGKEALKLLVHKSLDFRQLLNERHTACRLQ